MAMPKDMVCGTDYTNSTHMGLATRPDKARLVFGIRTCMGVTALDVEEVPAATAGLMVYVSAGSLKSYENFTSPSNCSTGLYAGDGKTPLSFRRNATHFEWDTLSDGDVFTVIRGEGSGQLYSSSCVVKANAESCVSTALF